MTTETIAPRPLPIDRVAQPEARCRPPRAARYHSLDFWRGVACLLVVLFHASLYVRPVPGRIDTWLGWLPAVLAHCWVGVPLFFVISGYCISGAVESAARRPNPVGSYFRRRLRRIYPPFWICVALAVPVVTLVDGHLAPGLFADRVHPIQLPASLSVWQWAGNLTLSESWLSRLLGQPRYFMGHAWTLCYEEQFYAVMGAVLWLSRRRIFPAVLAVTLGGAVLQLLLQHLGAAPVGFFLDGQWLLFAAGVLVYWRVNHTPRRRWPLAEAVLAAAALLAGAGMAQPRWVPLLASVGSEAGLVAFTFALLLCVLHRWDRPIAAARPLRPVRWCGSMCYSLYLVHWPLVKAISHALYRAGLRGIGCHLIVTLPLCLAAAMGAGWAFHILVERRFLNTPSSV